MQCVAFVWLHSLCIITHIIGHTRFIVRKYFKLIINGGICSKVFYWTDAYLCESPSIFWTWKFGRWSWDRGGIYQDQNFICTDTFAISMPKHNDDYWVGMFDIKVMKSWIKLSSSAESPLNFLGGTSHPLSILNSHQTYIPNWWTPCYEANKCDKKLEIKLDQISRHDQYQKMSKYQTKYQNLTNYHPSTKYQNLTKHQKLTKYQKELTIENT